MPKSMPWFRMHTEARTDAKLDFLPDDQHRVWFKLLCMAAEQEQRGTITYNDIDLLAVEVAKGNTTLLTATLATLAKLQIITHHDSAVTFVHFLDRQYDKPSDIPAQVTARQRRHRHKDGDTPRDMAENTRDDATNNAESRAVTRSHAIDTDTDLDTEELKKAACAHEDQEAAPVTHDTEAHYRDIDTDPEELLHPLLRGDRYPHLRQVCLKIATQYQCRVYPESPAFDGTRILGQMEGALAQFAKDCDRLGRNWTAMVDSQLLRPDVDQPLALATGTTERPWTTLHRALQYLCGRATEHVSAKRQREKDRPAGAAKPERSGPVPTLVGMPAGLLPPTAPESEIR